MVMGVLRMSVGCAGKVHQFPIPIPAGCVFDSLEPYPHVTFFFPDNTT